MSTVRRVNVQEAKTHLSRLLREVEAGEVIEIARAGTVVARLERAGDERAWGCFEGQVRYEADAFAPLSEEDADEWSEGSPEPAGRAESSDP